MMLAVTVAMVVDVNVAVAVPVIVAITIIEKMMESLQSLRRKNCPNLFIMLLLRLLLLLMLLLFSVRHLIL